MWNLKIITAAASLGLEPVFDETVANMPHIEECGELTHITFYLHPGDNVDSAHLYFRTELINTIALKEIRNEQEQPIL